MTKELFVQAILKFALGVVLIGALLFLPAGTFAWMEAWLFLGMLFVPMFFAGIWMIRKNPSLLQKRLIAKEKLHKQDILIKI